MVSAAYPPDIVVFEPEVFVCSFVVAPLFVTSAYALFKLFADNNTK